jgi:signal transduction histidine kinase
MTWSMTAKAKPYEPPEFESVLLAIAGHDLRQPLQVIQNVHDILGRGLRTTSELRLLQYGQSAVERLRDQLDELLAALRLCESGKRVKLTSVQVEPLLQQATYADKVAALKKGVSVRTVPTSATIESDALLLGTVLRNLVSNAIKYTQPGGHVLVGCRHIDQRIRIDVYDTGIGITGDQMPRMFEAFTRFDPARWSGHWPLHRAPGDRNSGTPHRRHFHSLSRVTLFHFREPGRMKVRNFLRKCGLTAFAFDR